MILTTCAFAAGLLLGVPGAAQAQVMSGTNYDLESLDAEITAPGTTDVCAKFSPELRTLAGCEDAAAEDPTLEGVNDPAELSNDSAFPAPSPYDPVDPSADMVNGLAGGGGTDGFGMALDDLTGGLAIGDMP